MSEIIRQRRAELGLTQADLAALAGVDTRQIRRYEAGEGQPTLPIANAIAKALRISLDELAGEPTQRVDVSGNWWACWQTWNKGREILSSHQAHIRQTGDSLDIAAVTRGTHAFEEGGYLWRGEMRIWDNEILMGWYVADEGAVRSKGTMYFVLHQHGIQMTGRWVGLSYDGPIISGWSAMARTEDEAIALVNQLKEGKAPTHERH
ncbi:helix-turn-helix transcriptional regulator [Actinoplanes oblitus]|uniref:Helix-turn-helix transcriptional regulator n=1 Tax=Actinoplanes oblitus TaxID=3040509 RepID=A0ABY8WUY4_9ACTN|nr:helix-turn-helix transcriptional regulator [Actinoplanes oblitus]WIN00723.1 helix-turn-helix transcriptional regulator [Actinoplanes oblitus]